MNEGSFLLLQFNADHLSIESWFLRALFLFMGIARKVRAGNRDLVVPQLIDNCTIPPMMKINTPSNVFISAVYTNREILAISTNFKPTALATTLQLSSQTLTTNLTSSISRILPLHQTQLFWTKHFLKKKRTRFSRRLIQTELHHAIVDYFHKKIVNIEDLESIFDHGRISQPETTQIYSVSVPYECLYFLT